jgi:hypothetical protein
MTDVEKVSFIGYLDRFKFDKLFFSEERTLVDVGKLVAQAVEAFVEEQGIVLERDLVIELAEDGGYGDIIAASTNDFGRYSVARFAKRLKIYEALKATSTRFMKMGGLERKFTQDSQQAITNMLSTIPGIENASLDLKFPKVGRLSTRRVFFSEGQRKGLNDYYGARVDGTLEVCLVVDPSRERLPLQSFLDKTNFVQLYTSDPSQKSKLGLELAIAIKEMVKETGPVLLAHVLQEVRNLGYDHAVSELQDNRTVRYIDGKRVEREPNYYFHTSLNLEGYLGGEGIVVSSMNEARNRFMETNGTGLRDRLVELPGVKAVDYYLRTRTKTNVFAGKVLYQDGLDDSLVRYLSLMLTGSVDATLIAKGAQTTRGANEASVEQTRIRNGESPYTGVIM